MSAFLAGLRGLWSKPKEGEEDEQQQQQPASPPGHQQQAPHVSGHKRSRGSRAASAAQARGPILVDMQHGQSGGVQGLGWYTASLAQDADGTLAHEHVTEPAAGSGGSLQRVPGTRQAGQRQAKLAGVQAGRVLLGDDG